MPDVDRTPHLLSLRQMVLFFTIICLQHSLLTLPHVSYAIVRPNRTFTYKNQGEFGEYVAEYGANYRALPISNFQLILCYYNTTTDTFALGLRMSHRRSESLMRWIWEADRGRPVPENATLSFSFDNNNLVLADAAGSVARQTGTANKGVEGLSLLPNGNLVLWC